MTQGSAATTAAKTTDPDLYDVVVIGGGPAGLTAGLYLARARYRTLILEKEDFGGQITITAEVVNYPGIAKTTGKALTDTMHAQAKDFGAEFKSAEATGIDIEGDVKVVHTNRGDIRTFGVLIASGASPRKLGFQGENEYAGRGVAYCATCDGEFFTGKEVLVVGGGFAAAEESVFLTKYASKVTLLVREEDFTCDAGVAQEAKDDPNIEIHYHTELDEVSAGQGGLTEATIHDVHTGESKLWKPSTSDTFGVFVFAGYVPQTSVVKGLVDLDDYGYVITDTHLQTSVEGIYAAGDLCQKHLRQVVTATADGASAAVELERYASQLSDKTGLLPVRPTGSKSNKETTSTPAGTSPAPAPTPQATDSAKAAQGASAVFSDDVKAQLSMVFSRLVKPAVLQLELDGTPLSKELRGFISEVVAISGGKLSSVVSDDVASVDDEGKASFDPAGVLPVARPCVRICTTDADGSLQPTGLAFHGVPSGHEFNSFVLGIYNAAGPGQPLEDDVKERIAELSKPVDVMLLVSLTCTMCPETVLSSQRIAAANPKVRAEAYDVSHFPELKEQYGVMSVPCIVINRDDGSQTVEFGKKSVPQMLDLIGA